MSKVLRIIDTGSYIHAGAVNKSAFINGPVLDTGSGYKQCIAPAGGVSLIMNLIYEDHMQSDFLICCDQQATIKQGMYEGYKANREHKREIEVQKDVAEYVLRDCGYTVLSEAGYEADDFIYSAVMKFKSMYDKIYIHCNDKDMYFLIDSQVEIAKSHSRSKDVNLATYQQHSGVVYNTCTFDKILNGCSSDCIPALPTDIANKLKMAFYTESQLKNLGNKEYVRTLAEYSVPEAVKQIDLVFPLDAPIEAEYISQPNKEKILDWGYAMNNKYMSKRYREISTDVQSSINEMFNRGIYLE